VERSQEFEAGSQILACLLLLSPFRSCLITKGITSWKNSWSAQTGIADFWSLFGKATNSCAARRLSLVPVRSATTNGQATAHSVCRASTSSGKARSPAVHIARDR